MITYHDLLPSGVGHTHINENRQEAMALASDINRGEASADNSIQHVFIIGDREIIGSTPKNPVNKRDG